MTADCAAQLVAAGMSVAEADSKSRLFRRAESVVKQPDARWFVPGRIEVLGKHTDYAGGRSLLCAVERGMCVVAAARSDDLVRIIDAGNGQSAEFRLCADLEVPRSGWAVYPATVARRLARNFGRPLRGADIAFASDLPPSSGMSSSSVLIVATFTALSHVNRLTERAEYSANLKTSEDLAGYLGAVESGSAYASLAGDRGVGTFGGSEDHTAMLCSAPGLLVQYRFCPVVREATVPIPRDCTFVVASSGIVSQKTGAARERYNRVSQTAAEVLQSWREVAGRDDATLFAAASSSGGAQQRMREVLAESAKRDILLPRFEQFVEEALTIIPAATEALARGDLREFGEMVDRSQRAAEELLGNQVPETIALARDARSLGAHAASAFGAGFGGSVWALVDAQDSASFLNNWQTEYRARFPEAARRSCFFTTGAGPARVGVE